MTKKTSVILFCKLQLIRQDINEYKTEEGFISSVFADVMNLYSSVKCHEHMKNISSTRITLGHPV
jgi:hypothetical protein